MSVGGAAPGAGSDHDSGQAGRAGRGPPRRVRGGRLGGPGGMTGGEGAEDDGGVAAAHLHGMIDEKKPAVRSRRARA